MTTLFLILICWIALSIPVGIVVGKWLATRADDGATAPSTDCN